MMKGNLKIKEFLFFYN